MAALAIDTHALVWYVEGSPQLSAAALAALHAAVALGEPVYVCSVSLVEIAYLVDQEWARTAEDVLWRRTKCGLAMTPVQQARVAERMAAVPA